MDENKNKASEENEINLLALACRLWERKIFILKAILVGIVVGLVIAFSIPKEYTTTVVLISDSQSSGVAGSMSSLASLAGINIGGASGGDLLASPDLYPDIFKSTSFLKGLFDIPLIDPEHNVDTTFYSYLLNDQKQPWWSYILAAPGLLKDVLFSEEKNLSEPADAASDNERSLSEEQLKVIESLKSKIIASSDKKTGITTLQVTVQNPKISAFLADTLTAYFQSYIIDYRTQKARIDKEYAEKLYEDAKQDYYKVQGELAQFVDRHPNLSFARDQIQQSRLQHEADLAYSMYNQSAHQLQVAKVKIQNTTPVFVVIQPAIESLTPSSPSKKMVLGAILFLSVVASILWVLKKDIIDMINQS